ncbi:MAG: frataxin-like iron-binding protein CyaY [Rickettsiales bacterium]|jgi:frataxin-like iron-binding protein CyaY
MDESDCKILADGQEYVINKRLASQKIWFSSPHSGAKYFTYDVNSDKCLDGDDELQKYLFSELDKFYDFSIPV